MQRSKTTSLAERMCDLLDTAPLTDAIGTTTPAVHVRNEQHWGQDMFVTTIQGMSHHSSAPSVFLVFLSSLPSTFFFLFFCATLTYRSGHAPAHPLQRTARNSYLYVQLNLLFFQARITSSAPSWPDSCMWKPSISTLPCVAEALR